MLQNVLPAHGLFHLRTLAAYHATHFAAASTDRVPWPMGRAPDLDIVFPPESDFHGFAVDLIQFLTKLLHGRSWCAHVLFCWLT